MVRRFVTVRRFVRYTCWRLLVLFLDHKYTERYIYIWIRLHHSPVSSIVKLVFVTYLSRWIFLYINCLISKLLIRNLAITFVITEPVDWSHFVYVISEHNLCCNRTCILISLVCASFGNLSPCYR